MKHRLKKKLFKNENQFASYTNWKKSLYAWSMWQKKRKKEKL